MNMISTIKKFICSIVLLSAIFAQAQQLTGEEPVAQQLSGVVLSSETGQPVPGVSVTISGVASAITDDEGKFVLRRTVEGAIVRFRAQGYADKEILAGNNTELKVELHDETFQTIHKRVGSPFGYKDWLTTTGSLTSISNREQYKKAAVSVESLIQDEGLGVNTLMRSGAPGAGVNMYLRGFSSINATNQPMILIDGVPFENSATAPSLVSGNFVTPLTGIDARDIENITILKDATSIFGSKGANGAILIETAKASEQATKIDFHAFAGVNPAPSNMYPMMNAWQYRSYLSEILGTKLLPNGEKYYTPVQIQALPYINQDVPVEYAWGVENNTEYYRYNKDTDWQKEVFKTSATQNYYLSIKGGDDIALYALSVGVLNRSGTIENTGFNRYNTQFNTQLNITSWMKLNSNMNFFWGSRQLAFESLSPNFNPMYVSMVKAPFMSPYIYDVYGNKTPNYEQADVFGISNPKALVDKQTSIRDVSYRFFGNVGAVADLGKYFDLGLTFGVIFDKTRENIFLPANGLNHDDLPAGIVTNDATALVARYFQYYSDARLGFRHVFDRKHDVSAKAGFRYQTNQNKANWNEAHNSSSDDLKSVGNGNLDFANTSGIIGDWKWLSLYFNGEYGYRKKYFLNFNMAVDGSSRFGKEASGMKIGDNIFGVFPSITGAWLLSSEDFMEGLKIDLLKLRVGYSVAGNDDIGNYTARSTYVSQGFFEFQGLVREKIANPELKWETNTRVNAGLDLAIFNERLRLSFDVYQSVTKDLLGFSQIVPFIGINSYVVNDGTMKNTGLDVGLQARIINRAVKWDFGVNAAHYKNELTAQSVDEKLTRIAGGNILSKVGKPVNLFYGYKTGGVFANSEDAAKADLHIQHGDGRQTSFKAGDVHFVKMSEGNVLDESDMTIIGDPNPVLSGSFVNRLQWKRFTMNMVFTYSYGNDIYNALRASVESMSGPENQTLRVLNRWNSEGHVTDVPRAVWDDPMGNSRFSDRWIEDGSYIRLKYLSLSYDIPVPARLNLISGLQVYVTANNLLTFTKYLGYDPEFNTLQSPLAYGVDTGIMPLPRTILFGVKLGL